MHKIRGNKRNKRFYKWIASLLTAILLINQSSFSVLAEEIREELCICGIRCTMDSVNEACPVCTADYGRCEGEEDVADTVTDEEAENPDASEDVNIDADTNIAPDMEANTVPDTELDMETSTELDMDADDESELIPSQYDEEESIIEEEVIVSEAEDAVSPVAVGDTFSDNTFIYTIINEDRDNLQVEVTQHVDGMFASGDLVIPSTVFNGTDEYTVVRIGYAAFHSCSSLTGITIPDSVASIGDKAFCGCTGLTGITIPDSVTQIEENAFWKCSGLTSVIIPDSVISIGFGAFYECSNLADITIPDSVTSIGGSAFQDCSSLTSITIPNSVTRIEDYAFSDCSSLASITISNSVTSIGRYAFHRCFSLTNITIPNSVTSIGLTAFYSCDNLTSVKILNDNIYISWGAFASCRKLNSFQIALSDNISGTPILDPVEEDFCFWGCPYDRSLTFLTKDGTTVLSNTTTPTLAEAVEAYNLVNDGGINDGRWYGWKLPEVTSASGYSVMINVNIDDNEWSDCPKKFALSSDHGSTFITDLTDVPNGAYTIYDITGTATSADYVYTGVTIAVNGADTEAEVNYYTVTFYNGDTVFAEQIVPNNAKVSAPSDFPTKDGYVFYRWATSNDGGTEFNFVENSITARTDIFASWITDGAETFTITASAGPGGSVSPSGEIKVKSGNEQRFTITPEDGYQIVSILVDDSEVLNSGRTIYDSQVRSTDAEINIKYYVFENVTGDHTLEAYFEAVNTDDNDNSDDTGGDAADDNNGSDVPDGDTVDDNNDSDVSGSDVTDNNNSSDISSGDTVDDNHDSDGSDNSIPVIASDTSIIVDTNIISESDTAPASRDKEPKTGDASYVEIYATIAMIAGLSYLLLYFADEKSGMTEEEKKEIVAALVKWAKKGKCFRRYAALAIIFLILVYYHSIGKRTSVEWKEVYEK